MFSASDPQWNGHIVTATTGIPEMVANTEVMLKLNLVDPTEQFQWLLLDAIRRFLDYLESVLET